MDTMSNVEIRRLDNGRNLTVIRCRYNPALLALQLELKHGNWVSDGFDGESL